MTKGGNHGLKKNADHDYCMIVK